VAPNGALIIIGHAGFPSWEHEPRPEIHFPATEEIPATVLENGIWNIERDETVDRNLTGADGKPAQPTDNVLTVRRIVD
jgi:hypothetical protein